MVSSLEVKVNGEIKLACFGMQSIMELQEHYGSVEKLADAFKKNQTSLHVCIIYYTLKSGLDSKGKILDFSITDVYEWINDEENLQEFINLIEKFTESYTKYIKELTEEIKETGKVAVTDKKKETGVKK